MVLGGTIVSEPSSSFASDTLKLTSFSQLQPGLGYNTSLFYSTYIIHQLSHTFINTSDNTQCDINKHSHKSNTCFIIYVYGNLIITTNIQSNTTYITLSHTRKRKKNRKKRKYDFISYSFYYQKLHQNYDQQIRNKINRNKLKVIIKQI